ncbi:CYFA0S01e16358g1_1 [Cyberlindnera fabianii]|uniref:RNA exonuclease 4 n=1 Tax=Cyberlindnera fabianii TaxID=36022 RepID=A0A061AJL1_CYBFA|nr:RNA exonuclease 4 [Cyberlindnera fabianii]CDR37750.1 CYFA0S01e16358g1_1 [Cyberlindnera fabianii]
MGPLLKPGQNWLKLKNKTKVKKPKSKKSTAEKASEKTKSIINKITADIEKKQSLKDPKDIKKWAEENDIPLDDVSKTYELPKVELTEAKLSAQKKTLGTYLAIDCEFVGVGPDGLESALARVSVVNFHGHTVYDKFVKPREKVTDWRTWVSGVTPAHMKDATDFKTAQKEVASLLDDRILVGHAVEHDLESLFLSHPKAMIRDTSKFPGFRKLAKGKTPGLKKLAKEVLGLDIQGAEHSSVEDARATMMLYKHDKKEFDRWATARYHIRR